MQVAWIETFLAIVERGSFGSAAASLFRSQSRVSAHVASLEQELGAKLFDRSERPVSLTPAGNAFLGYALATRMNLDAARAAVRVVEGITIGDLTIGSHPSAAASFLAPVLKRFAKANPGVHVNIVDHAIYFLDDAFRAGQVGLMIRPQLPALSVAGLVRRPLWREPMVAVVAKDHPFARQTTLSRDALRGVSLITTGRQLGEDTEAGALLKANAIDARIAVRTDYPQVLVGFAEAGLGVAFTNALALETVVTDGVAVVPFAEPMYRVVDLYWLEGVDEAPAVDALREEILGAPLPPHGEPVTGADAGPMPSE